MNEELQSTNEELHTINGELRLRSDDLNRTNGFLEGILGSLRTAVVVLDEELRVTGWNDRARELWGLRGEEVRGQHFLNLDIGMPTDRVKQQIRACVQSEGGGEGGSESEVVVEAHNRRGRQIRCKLVCSPMRADGKSVKGRHPADGRSGKSAGVVVSDEKPTHLESAGSDAGARHSGTTGSDFFAKVDALRARVVEMQRHVPAGASGDAAGADQAFEELSTALEELTVAEEELYERNAKLVLAQQTLEDERRRYHDLFELAPDGYLVTDADSRIREANRAAGPLLKIRSDLLVGRVMRDFVPPDSEPVLAEQLERARATGMVQEFELPLRRRPDPPITASVRLMANRDRDGRVVSFRWLIRDVTEQKRNTERLRMLNVELERRVAERTAELAAASQAKDQFLAVLSHELRTPLTPVLTAAMALDQDADRPEEVHRLADMIRRNVELEARLIEDLLDLTRVSQGKLHFQREPVNLHRAIERAMDTCRSDMYGKCQQVDLQLTATRPIVHADSARIQQVLWNLLKNAVKFTPESGKITVRTEDAGDERVRVHITDTGIGMDADVARRAFDAFEQGGDTITRRFGGMGLGLTISRTLVDAHGGTLTASSNGPGKGSTFTIELPGATAPQPRPQAPPPHDAAPSAKKLRILLVEDHADTARIMSRLLRRLGHVVQVADTVQGAVDVFEREPVDLVLSDLGLPDGTGIDLMRRINGRRPVQAIALSGYGMEADVKKSLAAGFRKHLTKPVNFTHLQEAIESVMG